jgi:hypothetical protein
MTSPSQEFISFFHSEEFRAQMFILGQLLAKHLPDGATVERGKCT